MIMKLNKAVLQQTKLKCIQKCACMQQEMPIQQQLESAHVIGVDSVCWSRFVVILFVIACQSYCPPHLLSSGQ